MTNEDTTYHKEQLSSSDQVSEINFWLRSFATVEVEPRVSLEEVTYGSSYDWDWKRIFNSSFFFSFNPINSKKEADKLIEQLAFSNDDADDVYKSWVSKAFSDEGNNEKKVGSQLVTVHQGDSPTPVGFFHWETNIFVEDESCDFVDENKRILRLEIDAHSIYVKPEYRGKGFASALRWAMDVHLLGIFKKIKDIPKSKLGEMGITDFTVLYSGESYSTEGLWVARLVSEALQGRIADICSQHDPWFGDIELNDQFCYDDFHFDDGDDIPVPKMPF